MTGNEVREKYLKFFEKRGHKIISPSPLVLTDNPTTLFTSAGMQPLVPYLLGKEHEEGKRLVDSQPCFRAQDIEEVGDNRHDTFFEMLGNWSLGDYFKKEQIPWIWEFITKELKLDPNKIHVTLFEGYKNIPKDEETYKLWTELGIPDERIHYYGNKNWWSISGPPDAMQENEIGGPDSEIFFEFTHIKHDKKYGEKCHPNCDCGRFIEIGNSVFIQYRKINGELVELPNKNVDFGGGLERLTAVTENTSDIFKTSLFWPIIEEIEKMTDKKYVENEEAMRVIADHIKAATFLIADGVIPGNKLQSYVLRRLIRRAAVKMHFLKAGLTPIFSSISDVVLQTYDIYFDRNEKREFIFKIMDDEMDKFSRSLDKGLKEFEKYEDDQLNGLNAFGLYQNYGFPLEVTQELFKQKGREWTKSDQESFYNAMKFHQETSRKLSSNKFKLK